MDGQILSHRVGDAVAVLATLNATLGNVLDLCASVSMSVNWSVQVMNSVRTCFGTKSEQNAPSSGYRKRYAREQEQ
jgi:hypothetical protein